MSRRIHDANAFETGLAAAINASVTSIILDSTVGLTAPGYMTLDPTDPLLIEIIRFETINVNTLENCTRGLPGSVGGIGQAHALGARARMTFKAQHLDEIFSDIEDLEQADTDHIAAGDPHTTYLRKAGGTMTGSLVLDGDPDAALKAATKQYVDAFVVEGTWTPTLQADGPDPSVTYQSQVGIYVKVGPLVTIWWTLVLDVVTTQGSGTYQIAGMPFDFAAGVPTWQPIGVHDYFDSVSDTVMISRKHLNTSDLISMIYDNNGDGTARHLSSTTITLMQDDAFQGQATYLTDA